MGNPEPETSCLLRVRLAFLKHRLARAEQRLIKARNHDVISMWKVRQLEDEVQMYATDLERCERQLGL